MVPAAAEQQASTRHIASRPVRTVEVSMHVFMFSLQSTQEMFVAAGIILIVQTA
jgi:hypothetical protein